MIKNIQSFLTENAALIRHLSDRRDTSIGFNAFTLASDIYYRENFHSDIIAAILDPSAKHGEGKMFLSLFIRCLETAAMRQNKQNIAEDLKALYPLNGNIIVTREEGRVDVKIAAPEWVIIIENKINGAADMPRQLPRYVEECGGPKKVKAIVYLTASEPKDPDKNGWENGDSEMVDSRLIKLVGFSETPSRPNLVDGWLAQCELAANGFATKSILAQYSELVKHQAGETMNQEEVKKLFASLSQNDIDYTNLLAALNAMPHVLADMTVAKFKDKPGLKRAFIYKDTVAVFDLDDLYVSNDTKQPVCLAIDVHCEALDRLGISILSRSVNKVPLKSYEGLMKSFNSSFVYEESWDRIVLRRDTNSAFRNIDTFIGDVGKLIDFLCEKRGCLQEIACGNA